MSVVDWRFVKAPCSRCGEMTYRVVYIGSRLVCVPCFRSHIASIHPYTMSASGSGE